LFGIYNSGRVFAWNRRGYFQPECDRAGHSGTVPATLAPVEPDPAAVERYALANFRCKPLYLALQVVISAAG
jgi:hypothetical protein